MSVSYRVKRSQACQIARVSRERARQPEAEIAINAEVAFVAGVVVVVVVVNEEESPKLEARRLRSHKRPA